jgi:hypothetical protein
MTNQPNPAQPADAPHTDAPVSTEDAPSAPPSTTPEPEPTKRSRLTRFLVPVVIGLALIGFKVWNSQTAADQLQVGQCVAREGDDGIRGIDCGDAKAEFKILHIAQSTKESAAEQVCGPFAETTTTYYEGKDDGSKGDLICLAPAK